MLGSALPLPSWRGRFIFIWPAEERSEHHTPRVGVPIGSSSLCASEEKAAGAIQVPLLSGLSCCAQGQGRLESFLEKEKQDSESSLLAAFILAWVFYNGIVMIRGIFLVC